MIDSQFGFTSALISALDSAQLRQVEANQAVEPIPETGRTDAGEQVEISQAGLEALDNSRSEKPSPYEALKEDIEPKQHAALPLPKYIHAAQRYRQIEAMAVPLERREMAHKYSLIADRVVATIESQHLQYEQR